MNPLRDNPLRSRADLQAAVRDLFEPLKPHFSPGRASMVPGATGAWFPERSAGLEGFARPLWALAPLAAGGGSFDWWPEYRRGLVNGTDPDHPEYWGELRDHSQDTVEVAEIGFALATVPEHLWEPLDADERSRVADWMRGINDVAVADNNHLLFRVFANLGLRSVGVAHDAEQVRADLDRIEEFYLDGGWYADGPDRPSDYYIPWEMHVDGLLYADLVDDDPERAARFHDRAAAFAPDFARWFGADGAAIPYGRSLTYRFAQGAFWGALAVAGVEALPWEQVKGLWLRNLRWWAERPIFTDGGVLSIGYGYPSLKMAERYNSPSSPYWAMKCFLPLALPEDHPFWRVEEAPMPDVEERAVQEHPEMVIARDGPADHVVALTNGQGVSDDTSTGRTYEEKYAKFAYSTVFGIGVASGPRGLENAAPDSMLLVTRDGRHFRGRTNTVERSVDPDDGVVYTRSEPWPDVRVETWLTPAVPWHVRVHRIRTETPVESVEGGFGVDKSGDDVPSRYEERAGDGSAVARYPAGLSGVRALLDGRDGDVVAPDPNTNLLHPRVAVPVLRGEHAPGEHRLATAVLGDAAPDRATRWQRPPDVELRDGRAIVTGPDGTPVLDRPLDEA